MILPSRLLLPVTQTAGYFQCAPKELTDWLVSGLGRGWRKRQLPADSIQGVLQRAARETGSGWYTLLPVDGWTVVLNDTPLGTDVGMLPSQAARELECRAVRATATPRGSVTLEATILELFEPSATADPQHCRRSIVAADEGGRWLFAQSGDPFPFEDTDAYRRRRIRDRFTPELLERYLVQLGVPVDQQPDTGAALVVAPP